MFYLLALEAQQSGSQTVASRGQQNEAAPFFMPFQPHQESPCQHAAPFTVSPSPLLLLSH
jgi:hypothetical protein